MLYFCLRLFYRKWNQLLFSTPIWIFTKYFLFLLKYFLDSDFFTFAWVKISWIGAILTWVKFWGTLPTSANNTKGKYLK